MLGCMLRDVCLGGENANLGMTCPDSVLAVANKRKISVNLKKTYWLGLLAYNLECYIDHMTQFSRCCLRGEYLNHFSTRDLDTISKVQFRSLVYWWYFSDPEDDDRYIYIIDTGLTHGMSIFVQVMAISQYLSQCWPNICRHNVSPERNGLKQVVWVI